MKFRTKLYLSLTSLACLTLAIGVAVISYQEKRYIFNTIQAQALSIAATVASQLDGNALQEVKTRADEKGATHRQIKQILREARDANRNKSIYVTYIYTLYPNPQNPHEFLFGVSSEENDDQFFHTGELAPLAEKERLYEHRNEAYASDKAEQGKYGIWLAGYAPVYNAQGQYVASVGVDISEGYIHHSDYRILTSTLIALMISIFFALICSRLLTRRIAKSLDTLDEAAHEIGTGNLAYRIDLQTNDEFEVLAHSMNKMCEGLEEKEKLKVGFSHYVSQHVLDSILKAKGTTKLAGERRKITVFFSDIRNFTHMAEQLPAEQVVAILNDYFTTMIDIIFKHNGMLDKMIGDAIMAEFGVPLDDPQQERNAVLTALEMQEALRELCQKWKKEGKPEIEIGVGIHTGEAIVGSVGSEKRMEFTAIGDTVNIASRLEAATRETNQQIIVSERTHAALQGEFPSLCLGPLTLKGKKSSIIAYAILPKSAAAEKGIDHP